MVRLALCLVVFVLAGCEKKSESGPAGGKPVTVDAAPKPQVDAAPAARATVTADAAPAPDAAPALDAAPAPPKPTTRKEKVNHPNPPPDDMPTKKHECPRLHACGIGCPGAMAKDANGCTLCACEKEWRPGDQRPDSP